MRASHNLPCKNCSHMGSRHNSDTKSASSISGCSVPGCTCLVYVSPGEPIAKKAMPPPKQAPPAQETVAYIPAPQEDTSTSPPVDREDVRTREELLEEIQTLEDANDFIQGKLREARSQNRVYEQELDKWKHAENQVPRIQELTQANQEWKQAYQALQVKREVEGFVGGDLPVPCQATTPTYGGTWREAYDSLSRRLLLLEATVAKL